MAHAPYHTRRFQFISTGSQLTEIVEWQDWVTTTHKLAMNMLWKLNMTTARFLQRGMCLCRCVYDCHL